jgi:branched-chain amino acid transport system ATP-binding protein
MSTLVHESDPPVLWVSSLAAYYGELRAIYDISLELRRGDVLAIIGANGAGKIDAAALAGWPDGARGGTSVRGAIEFEGKRIDHLRSDQIVDAGGDAGA